MIQAYSTTHQHPDKRKKREISRHDEHIPSLVALQLGDRALDRNLSQRHGTGKLRRHWGESLYKIVSAIGDTAVIYKIIPENVDKAKKRIVHRSMLLNCDNLLDKFKGELDENNEDIKARKEK